MDSLREVAQQLGRIADALQPRANWPVCPLCGRTELQHEPDKRAFLCKWCNTRWHYDQVMPKDIIIFDGVEHLVCACAPGYCGTDKCSPDGYRHKPLEMLPHCKGEGWRNICVRPRRKDE